MKRSFKSVLSLVILLHAHLLTQCETAPLPPTPVRGHLSNDPPISYDSLEKAFDDKWYGKIPTIDSNDQFGQGNIGANERTLPTRPYDNYPRGSSSIATSSVNNADKFMAFQSPFLQYSDIHFGHHRTFNNRLAAARGDPYPRRNRANRYSRDRYARFNF